MSHGESPIPHTEITSWLGLSGIGLDLWEVETITWLSTAYLIEQQNSKASGTLPPYMTEQSRKEFAANYAAQRRAALTQGR